MQSDPVHPRRALGRPRRAPRARRASRTMKPSSSTGSMARLNAGAAAWASAEKVVRRRCAVRPATCGAARRDEQRLRAVSARKSRAEAPCVAGLVRTVSEACALHCTAIVNPASLRRCASLRRRSWCWRAPECGAVHAHIRRARPPGEPRAHAPRMWLLPLLSNTPALTCLLAASRTAAYERQRGLRGGCEHPAGQTVRRAAVHTLHTTTSRQPVQQPIHSAPVSGALPRAQRLQHRHASRRRVLREDGRGACCAPPLRC